MSSNNELVTYWNCNHPLLLISVTTLLDIIISSIVDLMESWYFIRNQHLVINLFRLLSSFVHILIGYSLPWYMLAFPAAVSHMFFSALLLHTDTISILVYSLQATLMFLPLFRKYTLLVLVSLSHFSCMFLLFPGPSYSSLLYVFIFCYCYTGLSIWWWDK